jgi:anti-sigma regulatory factor (Ser/Thr protein kinase)
MVDRASGPRGAPGEPQQTGEPDTAASRTTVAAGLRLTSESWREDSSGRRRTRAFWSGPAIPEIVRPCRQAVAAAASAAGVSGTRLNDVRTCVSEGVTNAVVHAFRDGRTRGTVTVAAEFSREEMMVIIKDDGIGFLRRTDSPGLGLGLPTIRTVADSMSIATATDGGTELSMMFKLA